MDFQDLDLAIQVASIEYTWGSLTVAAEAKKMKISDTVYAADTVIDPGLSFTYDALFYYVSASYQITDDLGVGVYYSFRDDNADDHTVSGPNNTGKDYCAAVSYALTDWWLLKLEYHRIDGFVMLDDVPDTNTKSNDQWNYFVLKTTVSF